jgi:DNA-binding beta-propeller fold protein YncE
VSGPRAGALLLAALGLFGCGRRAGGDAADARPRRVSVAAPDTTPVLTTVADVPLPGPPVRFDYQSLDIRSDRLYISHMGAGEIVVFNVRTRKVERTIGGLPGVTGVLAVHALGRIYASVTGLRRVAVIDAHTFKIVAWLGDIAYPDALAYAPDAQKIYVSDEGGGKLLVIHARTDSVEGTIPLDGEAGNTLFDPGSRCILVAVQTRDELYVIDPNGERILGRFPLAGAARPHGLAIDAVRRLAFVANESDATLLVVDLRMMKVLDRLHVGVDPDVLAFDRLWRRLYVGSESGVLSVFTETPTGLVHDGDLYLPHAHTVAVDQRTHLVYVPLENSGGKPVLRILAGAPPRGR